MSLLVALTSIASCLLLFRVVVHVFGSPFCTFSLHPIERGRTLACRRSLIFLPRVFVNKMKIKTNSFDILTLLISLHH